MITKKASAIIGTTLMLMAPLLVFPGSSYAYGNLWCATWHQWQSYVDHPENASTISTVYSYTGTAWFKVALVVSAYSYESWTPQEDRMTFRVCLLFESYSESARDPIPARIVELDIDKDTGANINDHRMNFIYDPNAPPGYHEGGYLWQTEGIDSDGDERYDWVSSALGFAIDVLGEPIDVLWDLIDIASSFEWSSPDYYNAGPEDTRAVSIWRAEGVDFSGCGNPLRQYCFNTVDWFQNHAVNPPSSYTLRVSADIIFDSFMNPYNFTTFEVPPVVMSIYHYVTPPGGGSCPFVSVWTGNNYVVDNNLLPASELHSGADVEDYYRLERTPVAWNDRYWLTIDEFEGEHDFFDQVKLLRVDHPPDTSIATSSDGRIFTYSNPHPPVSAITNDHENVKTLLNQPDGKYYQGYEGSYLDLNFGDELDISQGLRLVLRTDMKCADVCIKVQVQTDNGDWNTVAVSIPRRYWSTDIIDITEYLPDAKDNFKVRLFFTDNHKLDFVGLDTSPQTITVVQQGELISAIHSDLGDVTNLLLHNDATCAQLFPGQQIQLEFTLPDNTNQAGTYILYSKGYYYRIES